MPLKYNSRATLESKLRILKCCIGTKAIEVSNSIALALGNVDCLVQELELLEGYYDALNCYYPYDCYEVNVVTTYRVWTPDIIDWTLGEIAYLSPTNQTIFFNTGNNTVLSTYGFYEVIDVVNANLGEWPTDDNDYWAPISTCDTPSLTTAGTNTLFSVGLTDFTINVDGIWTCSITNICDSLKTILDAEDNFVEYEIQDPCLTDEEAEKMMRNALSYCECCLDIQINNEPFN